MNNFCPQPWVGLDINAQGKIQPCCKYEESISDDLNDYFNSPLLLELKQQFLNNEKPIGCKRCWDDERAGLASKRQLDIKYLLNYNVQDLDSIKILSLPFGNTCNLACRTCSSYSSSKWSVEERELVNYFPDIKIHQHKKFYKDKNFIETVKSVSEEVLHITFPGGEPFITGVDEHLNYLSYLIDAKKSSNISLTYITNCTTFPAKEFWEMWEKFKKVEIQLSIDGIEDKFEYIRWPANWDHVYNNIKKYISVQGNNFSLSISHTISIFNIFYINEFVIWCLKNKLPKPYFGLVEKPFHYNVINLPPNAKSFVEKKLKPYPEIVKFMNNKNNLEVEILKKNIEIIDKQRNQTCENVLPELWKFLNE